MARRGEGIYLRKHTFWLDFQHDGKRHWVLLGKLPVRIQFEVDYSAIHPDDIGSRWNFRLSFTPVIPNLLKGGF